MGVFFSQHQPAKQNYSTILSKIEVVEIIYIDCFLPVNFILFLGILTFDHLKVIFFVFLVHFSFHLFVTNFVFPKNGIFQVLLEILSVIFYIFWVILNVTSYVFWVILNVISYVFQVNGSFWSFLTNFIRLYLEMNSFCVCHLYGNFS